MSLTLKKTLDTIKGGVEFIVIVAIFGGLMYATFSLSIFWGCIARFIVILAFLTTNSWVYAKMMRNWGPLGKMLFLVGTQLAALLLITAIAWMRTAAEFTEPVIPFLQQLRMMGKYSLYTFINLSGNSVDQYFGITSQALSLLLIATVVFAACMAVVVNINCQKLEAAHKKGRYWHVGEGWKTYTADVMKHVTTTTTYNDGTKKVQVDSYKTGRKHTWQRYDESRWIYYDYNDPEKINFWQPIIPFVGYLTAPVVTFAAVCIWHTFKLARRTVTKVVVTVALVAAVAGIYAASNMARVNGDSFTSRIITPTFEQVQSTVSKLSSEASAQFANFMIDIRRPGGFTGNTVAQIKEEGQTIRYFNIRNSMVAYKGEFWTVTQNGQTVVYHKYDDKKIVYKSGSEVYSKVMKSLTALMPNEVANKWLPFYADKRFEPVTGNRANENKMVLLINKRAFGEQGLNDKIEHPVEFYITDNQITMYDFDRYGRLFRASITYGNANITLPDDLTEYPDEL